MSGERGITVSLPYFACRSSLRRAVESVLGQAHGDLTLIVVNDGDVPEPWDLLADIKDRRLVRFDLGANRGRYFADAVVMAATEDQYFMVQDAGDWSSPDRAALLYETLREGNAGAAFCAVNEYPARVADGPAGTRAVKLSFASCTHPRPGLTPITHQAGLYQTGALRAIGGCYGGFRSGYGTLLAGLLALTAGLAYLDVPLYHQPERQTPLTGRTGPGTDLAARRAVRARLDGLYHEAYRGFCEYTSGRRSLADLCQLTSALVAANVTAPEARELAAQSTRLRAQLARRGDSRPAQPRRPTATASLARADAVAVRSTMPGKPDVPDLTVVIPTRHDVSALPSTIGSFLAARTRGTRLEFVIVDDASPTGVDAAMFGDLLREPGPSASLTVLRPHEHIGITRARNLGARHARAGHLFITDAHVKVEPGWDAVIAEYAGARRILAATIESDQTGACGFGASLELPALTLRWNTEPGGDLAAVQVAASAGMVVDRELYWSVGGFDPGMILYGSAEAEFSVRAWLRGAEVVNLPGLIVAHRFRSAAERRLSMAANLHFVLHNRLRFALLYLPDDAVLRVLREMAALYPSRAVTRACDLVAASDVWRRRTALRKHELFSFGWFSRKFGLDAYTGHRDPFGLASA
jgi:glycosyltransferase involved in cell wall biosynthesis